MTSLKNLSSDQRNLRQQWNSARAEPGAQVVKTEGRTYAYSHHKEVIVLKFGDIIIAVASLTVIGVLIMFPATLVFTPALGSFEGFMLSAVIAFLLSAIITGYIFTRKIWEENRTRTIAKIAVLFTLLVMVLVLVENAASGDWTPMVKEIYLDANPTATPSTTDWYYIERLALIQDDFFNVVILLAITFIGLYIGSTLKRPAKT